MQEFGAMLDAQLRADESAGVHRKSPNSPQVTNIFNIWYQALSLQ